MMDLIRTIINDAYKEHLPYEGREQSGDFCDEIERKLLANSIGLDVMGDFIKESCVPPPTQAPKDASGMYDAGWRQGVEDAAASVRHLNRVIIKNKAVAQ